MESRRNLKTAAAFSAALLLVQALSAPLFASASDMDYLTHDPRYQGCTMVDCIDVSVYQGDIDWNAVAADGIGEVILRLGFRGWGDTGDLRTDDRFAENLIGAKNAGLDVGVYFFTQAVNPTEAAEEANYVLGVLTQYSEYEVNCPIYFDIETVGNPEARLDRAYLSPAQYTENCIAFCSTIEAAGYQAGVYANLDWLENYLIASELESRYSIWLAHYCYQTSYTGQYQVWQYSNEGFVNGIDGPVDRNVVYLDGSSPRSNRSEPDALVPPQYYYDGSVMQNPVLDTDTSVLEIPPLYPTETVLDNPSLNFSEILPVTPAIEVLDNPELNLVSYGCEELTLGNVGDFVQPIISGSGPFTYQTSDPSVAQVDSSGTITATGIGDACITATSANGVSDSIRIHVANAAHVNVSASRTLLTTPGEVIQLQNPELDMSKVTTDNAGIVQVYCNGLIKTTGYGNATITLYDRNGNPVTCHLVSPVNAPVAGDCNLDGNVNAGDASSILCYSADAGSGNSQGLTFSHQTVYDFNGDGSIDSSDAAGVLMQSALNGVGG